MGLKSNSKKETIHKTKLISCIRVCNFIFGVFGVTLSTNAQTVTPITQCVFPTFIQETSGIVVIDSARVLTHNDSGDSARVFIYNHTTCTVEKTVCIRNYSAKDIEAITIDDSGYVYVADVGNNAGNRTDLCVLKTSLADILALDTVDAQKINYAYGDQIDFTASTHNFDCEALLHFNDTLFLFSKNHGLAGTYCKIYALPDAMGTYTLMPKDSVALPTWVTDAALSPDKTRFVLNAESRLYGFTVNATNMHFDTLLFNYAYSFLSQKEGVSFINDTALFVTDEKFATIGGKLYRVELNDVHVGMPNQTQNEVEIVVSDNNVVLHNKKSFPIRFTMYTYNGQIVQDGIIYPWQEKTMLVKQHGVVRVYTNAFSKTIKF